MTPPLPVISAPPEVVRSWKEAASRALHAANRAGDPLITEGLARDAPDHVRELVVYLSEALTHAAGIFVGSVAKATPGVPPAIADGLAALIDQVTAEQAADRGREIDGVCPIPDPGGEPYRCACGSS